MSSSGDIVLPDDAMQFLHQRVTYAEKAARDALELVATLTASNKRLERRVLDCETALGLAIAPEEAEKNLETRLIETASTRMKRSSTSLGRIVAATPPTPTPIKVEE